MEKSENINELATALAMAQAEMSNPVFDSKNPHFKSSYASLASVRNTVIPVLAKHGLSVIQDVKDVENGVTCVQMLMHKSGQWMQTSGLRVPVDKNNAHGYGSATTYARRFSLMALTCVVGDDDDDYINVASETKKQNKTEINVDFLTMINDAQTLDDLVKVWSAIPKEQQILLTKAKDDKKRQLQQN